MKIRGSSYVFIVIMLIMLVVIGLSLRMEYLASKLVPLVASSGVLVLAAMGLRREIWARDKLETGGETTEPENAGETWRGYLVGVGWMAGFIGAIYFLGFIIATPMFVLAYMKRLGTTWPVATIFAAITTAIVYTVFELALEIDLYRGLLLTWLGH